MNNDIKKLPNGDFEVMPVNKDIQDHFETVQKLEDLIKEAMRIPTPLIGIEFDDDQPVATFDYDLEKHLPGVQESDFDAVKWRYSAPPGIADDMPEDYMSDYECILCEMGIPLVGAQPQQHQDPLPDPVGDFMWAIVKLNKGKEYFLRDVTFDGKREWTLDNTNCQLWCSQELAESFIDEHIGNGQAGVRGLLVGG